MKKIILLLVLCSFLISCNTHKSNGLISKKNNSKDQTNQKYVLVFINNVSNKYISKNDKNQLINSTNFKNDKNLIFHSEKNDSTSYDYGLELIVHDIEINEKKIAPKEINRPYNAYAKREYFDLETRITPVGVASISAKQTELIAHRVYKSCNIKAEINLVSFKTGKLLANKSFESVTNFSKVYNVTKDEGYLIDQNENDYFDLNNIGIMRNEAPLKNYKISTTYNVNYEPTDQEIKEQTFYKLKNKLIIFSNKII